MPMHPFRCYVECSRSKPDLMYMFSIIQAIFWTEHSFFAALVSSISLLSPLNRIQLSRSVLKSLSLCFLYDSRQEMFWASLLILAVFCFSWVQKKMMVLRMVGLNSMSWIRLKPSLREEGSISLTLARCEEKI